MRPEVGWRGLQMDELHCLGGVKGVHAADEANGFGAGVGEVALLQLAWSDDDHCERNGVVQLHFRALAVGVSVDSLACLTLPPCYDHDLGQHVAREHEHSVVIPLDYEHVAARVAP